MNDGRDGLVNEGLELNLAVVQLDVGLATLQSNFDLVSARPKTAMFASDSLVDGF